MLQGQRVNPGGIPPVELDILENGGIDIRHLLDFIFRRWKIVIATMLGILAVATIAISTITPKYTSNAQILLDPRKERVFGTEGLFPEMSLEAGNIDSQISIIQSTSLLRRVVEKEHLVDDPEFNGQREIGMLSYLRSLITAESSKSTILPTSPESDLLTPQMRAAIEKFKAALEVQRLNRTYVISVSITSSDPSKAARLANSVADAYVVDQLDARYEAAKRASAWLNERMESLSMQLRASEEALTSFRRQHNIVSTSGEAKITISEQQLSELNGKLMTARADTAEKRAKFEQAREVQFKGGNLQAVPDVVRSSVIANLRAQQAEIARREADLTSKYNDQHPLVINTRAERRDIERSISNEVSRIITNLSNDFDVARARELSLQNSLDEVSGLTGLNSDVGIRLHELERAAASNRLFYDNFLSRAKFTTEQSGLQERESRIITPATPPTSATNPKVLLILSLAAIGGFVVGICGAIAMDLLDAGFSSGLEIEKSFGLPVLASIPKLSDLDLTINNKLVDPARYLTMKPLSQYAESMRAIRVGIQMADVDNPAKVVMVTSSAPKEGKSTLAISLAFSAVKAGMKVILIDGDLRHTSTSRYFGIEDKPGLVDILTNSAPMENCATNAMGLFIIGAGSKSQNPPDLLGSQRMKQLISDLRKSFDYIILDSPPVAPVIDSLILTSLVDKIAFVVRWRDTSREIANRSIDVIDKNRKIAGVLLNLVDESRMSKFSSYKQYTSPSYNSYYQN